MHGRKTEPDTQTATACITLIESSKHAISKRFTLKDGKLVSDSSPCRLSKGRATVVAVDGVVELAGLINGMASNQALILSTPEGIGVGESIGVVAKQLQPKYPFAIQRAKAGKGKDGTFDFRPGPGYQLIDTDFKGCPDLVRKRLGKSVWEALVKVMPGLGSAARVARKSTSAGLEAHGQPIGGSDNQHLYLPIIDATDIPRTTTVLHQRMVLAGFGWAMVTAGGSVVIRSPVDASVGSPERLAFEGAPVLGEGLTQKDRLAHAAEGVVVDTRTAIPDLSETEQVEYKRKVDALRAGKAEEAETVRAACIRRVAVKRSAASGENVDVVAQRITATWDDSRLPLDWLLEFDDAKLGTVTVKDVLKSPETYIGQTLRDPLDPGYGPGKAQVLQGYDEAGGDLLVHSYAHGAHVYVLMPDARMAFEDSNIDMEQVEATAAGARVAGQRPRIEIRAGGLDKTMKRAEAELIVAMAEVYQRGGVLVRPVLLPAPSASMGVDTMTAAIMPVSAAYLRTLLSAVTDFVRWDARAKAWRSADPPHEVCDSLLANAGDWNFPVLDGISGTQTLRADGSVVENPGYDAITRTMFQDLPSMAPLPATLSRQDGEAALADLNDLITEFPFVDAGSRTVALSAMVTAVVRPCLAVAPMHVGLANMAGSGKSYLWNLLSAIAYGRPCPVVAAGRDNKETDARLTGALLQGQPIISLDNLNGRLESDLLCQAIEQRSLNLRRLGSSDMQAVSNQSLILANGNNVAITGDLTRRALLLTLDAGMEQPETRAFQSDPVAKVLADRGKYIRAALVVVKAYLDAGSPGRLPKLASFGDWSDKVRSALVWLGCADPCVTQDTIRANDPVQRQFAELMGAWYRCFGNTPTMAREVIARAPFDPGLNEAVLAIAGVRGVADLKKLGDWLQANRDARRAGFHLTGVTPSSKTRSVGWSVSWTGEGEPPVAMSGEPEPYPF